jgi:uncharacterized protein (TIGR02145 family)
MAKKRTSMTSTKVEEKKVIISLNNGSLEEVKIGNQFWMSKNLAVTHYRNGEQIPLAKSKKDWIKAVKSEKPMMCYYQFDAIYREQYGALYNWYAVTDNRGLAPEGWHIASQEEWNILIDKCGGEEKGGELIKCTNGWKEFMNNDLEYIGGNGNNMSGFSALPIGMIYEDGDFFGNGNQAHFWTATDYVKSSALDCRIFNDSNKIEIKASEKANGYSVRLIKD